MSHLSYMTNYVINYKSDVKCQLGVAPLARPEQPVPRIAQSRQDVAVLVQLAVQRRGEDRDVGVVLQHAARAFGRRDEAEEADALRAGVLERAHGVHGRAARGEHRIEHEEVARVARSEEHTSELQSQSNLVCR